jgi:N-acyl amino acid synthase of PEP-CTERM/exosortase system
MAGCDAFDRRSCGKLPVSKISSLDPTSFAVDTRKRAAEASRLCTLMPTTPRSDFASSPHKLRKPQIGPQRLVSHALQTSWMAIGLIRAARQYSLKHDILYCFFLISDPLARMLRRLGMEIEPVGSPCLHRGWRRPYIHNVKTGYHAMSTRSPELYKVFSRPIAYSRFSKWDNTAEALPLAACGGDHQPVIPREKVTQVRQKPADHSERQLLVVPSASNL